MSTETKANNGPTGTVWQPNDEQRAVLEALQAECAKEKTTVDFARKFLPFGRSLFDQMMDALDPKRVNAQGERLPSYWDKISPETVAVKFEELEAILEEIPRKRIQAARASEMEILVTSKIRAVEVAVRECSVKPGPERIILCPGPTGAGKTMMCNYLAKKHSARIVEVRAGWRRSETGFVPLMDICKAIGVRIKPGNNMSDMEDKLVAFCEGRSLVLCFDEGEHFGKQALNLLKFLTNKTRIVIVLFAVTREYEKWFSYFENEAEQTARRCHAIIETSVLDTKDVALFFKGTTFADESAALEMIAREASTFGHFSLVKRVATKLAGITKAEPDDVKKAIHRARLEMRREVK